MLNPGGIRPAPVVRDRILGGAERTLQVALHDAQQDAARSDGVIGRVVRRQEGEAALEYCHGLLVLAAREQVSPPRQEGIAAGRQDLGGATQRLPGRVEVPRHHSASPSQRSW